MLSPGMMMRRFEELDSSLGKRPKKIALQSLSGCRTWVRCGRCYDNSGEGSGNGPQENASFPEEFPVRAPTSEVVHGNFPSSSTENLAVARSNRGRIGDIYSRNDAREDFSDPLRGRSENRRVREIEYHRRRITELRSHLRAVRGTLKHAPSDQFALREKARLCREIGNFCSVLEDLEENPIRYPSREVAPPDSIRHGYVLGEGWQPGSTIPGTRLRVRVGESRLLPLPEGYSRIGGVLSPIVSTELPPRGTFAVPIVRNSITREGYDWKSPTLAVPFGGLVDQTKVKPPCGECRALFGKQHHRACLERFRRMNPSCRWGPFEALSDFQKEHLIAKAGRTFFFPPA